MEDFESGTMGTFLADNQDALLYGLAASDGYRCQHNDTDRVNSNNYGSAQCYIGATAAVLESASTTWTARWVIVAPEFTCRGALTFAHLGNADGPGLAGATGLGTWAESRFNLDRFKGRRGCRSHAGEQGRRRSRFAGLARRRRSGQLLRDPRLPRDPGQR